MIEKSSEVENLVLDPFMGVSTTLVAAAILNRRAIGIEIEKRYCDIARKRLQFGITEAGEGQWLSTCTDISVAKLER